MVWGYDYSARLVVDIVLHFIRLYIKKRKAQRSAAEAAKDKTKE